jgi:hypothetical protein
VLLGLLKTYEQIVLDYERRGVSTVRDPMDKENLAEEDAWHQQHYFDVGRGALEIIVSHLVANLLEPPETILDFPSGSGRVTRHLRAAFPEARIGACDLYESHVDFCAAEFGAEPIYSHENLDQVRIRPEWDLVFVGSLLTHLPKRQAGSALRLIQRSLSPRGIAIVTLEGRRSIDIQRHHYEIISPDRFRRIMLGYRAIGHGFSEYHPVMRRLFHKQASYGSAFIRPDWIAKEVLKLPDVRLLGYAERAWDDHQDVVVFGRAGATGLGAPWSVADLSRWAWGRARRCGSRLRRWRRRSLPLGDHAGHAAPPATRAADHAPTASPPTRQP